MVSEKITTRHQLLPPVTTLDSARTALLVIDMQTGFLEENSILAVDKAREIAEPINRLANRVRDAGGHVVFTRHAIRQDGFGALPEWQRALPWNQAVASLLAPGAPAQEIAPQMEILADDIVIDKFRASAFNPVSSNLDALLKDLRIETIIIVGCITNICCESTARDGHMLGYQTIVVEDAMAARTEAEHEAALLNLSAAFADVRRAEELDALIGGGERTAVIAGP